MDNKIMTAAEWVSEKLDRRMVLYENPYESMQQYADYYAREVAVAFYRWMNQMSEEKERTLPPHPTAYECFDQFINDQKK